MSKGNGCRPRKYPHEKRPWWEESETSQSQIHGLFVSGGWEAVRAVLKQMTRIIRTLLSYCDDRDPKLYTDSNTLLSSICDFKLVFGLILLKVVLSNTDSLSKYLQGKNMDVITCKKTADSMIAEMLK